MRFNALSYRQMQEIVKDMFDFAFCTCNSCYSVFFLMEIYGKCALCKYIKGSTITKMLKIIAFLQFAHLQYLPSCFGQERAK